MYYLHLIMGVHWVHAQFKPNLKTSRRQCLHSIYVGPYDHVIWYLWYFENSSLVNPMVYIVVVNTIYTQPDP